MSLLSYTLKQLLRHPWQMLITLCFAALAVVVLLVSVTLNEASKNHVYGAVSNIDIIVAAKGSPLQSVLANIFFIDNPTGNIRAKEAQRWKQHPLVQTHLPISLGDNYKGYKIVGAGASFQSFYNFEISEGESLQKPFDAVLGAKVAERLQLRVGDTFQGQHGRDDKGHTHENNYVVKGVLKPIGGPGDQVIWVHIDSYALSHHVSPEEADITALLLKTRGPLAKLQLPRMINESSSLIAAIPAIEADRLLKIAGGVSELMELFTWLFLLLTCLAIFAAFMSRLKEMKRNFAVLRLQGISGKKGIATVVLEASLLSFFGWILGLVFYLALTASFLQDLAIDYGLSLGLFPQVNLLTLSFLVVWGSALLAVIFPLIALMRSSLHDVIRKEAY